MPIAPTSTSEFLDLLKRSGLVSPEKLAEVSTLSLPQEPQKAAAILVSQRVVTRFQAQQLLTGRHKGFRIGAYIILDLLGRGGMGAVYLGEHHENRKKAAIKVLMPGKDDNQRLALERFQREARAAATLDHPNIVRVLDVYRPGESPYFVMEFVDGETLQQMITRDGPLPYPTATEYVAQAATGLQHALEQGFIHRDIKPANLMRDKSGLIKILDMGLARTTDGQDKLTEILDAGAVLGTADFIAPEQGMSHTVDIRADIYALGATFFALLIGRPPFDGNTTQKLLQHQLKAAPTLASIDPTLPPGLSVVVAKMLAKKPEDRYQTPAEVVAALEPWMGNSSRIVVGLSRTNLAQGADLQATLAEIRRNSGKHRRDSSGVVAVADPRDVEASIPSGARGTEPIARGLTTREPARPILEDEGEEEVEVETEETESPTKRKKPLLAYVALGILVIAAGAIAGVLSLGDTPKSPVVKNQPAPDQPPPKQDEPKPPPKTEVKKGPNPIVAPKVEATPAPEGKTLFRLDLAGVKPFVVRSGLTVDAADPNKKTHRLISQTGQPPADWTARAWNKDTEIEFFGEDEAKPVIGFRNAMGPGAAMLLMPKFDCPTGACKLKLEYSTNVRDGRFSIRFKPADSRPAWDVVKPPITGASWGTAEFDVELRGAAGGFFEFHNTDEQPTTAVRIRSFGITEKKSSAPPEPVLFSLDAADLPPFKNTKQGVKKTEGTDPPPIKGMVFHGWKPETLSAWECGQFLGAKAIGIMNLNEVNSAQIVMELEKADGFALKLQQGDVIRVRVVYRTSGSGRGEMYYQADNKPTDRVSLPNENDEWRTVDVVTTRADKPLRYLIDCTENGVSNPLFVRSIAVTLVAKAAPPAPPKK